MKTFAGALIIGIGICLSGQSSGILAESPREEIIKKELEKFQGTWRVIAVEENGQKVPEDKLRETVATVEIKGNKHTLRYPGKTLGPVTIKIEPTIKPEHYDMTIPEGAENGPNAGKTLQGIYELEGDTWKYCQDKTGKGRPTEFSGKAGSGWVLVIMKKEKPGVGKK
jgi:uncharacterized protein (TIGR03067 family)